MRIYGTQIYLLSNLLDFGCRLKYGAITYLGCDAIGAVLKMDTSIQHLE